MYKTYPVAYVKRLETKDIVTQVLLGISLAANISFFLFRDKLPFIPTQKKEEISIRQLTEAKVSSQVRLFISKTNPRLSYSEVAKIAHYEQKYAEKYGVPLELGLAITLQESHFNPDALSPTGPRGIKQIAPTFWAKECNTTKSGLFNPETNIECGYKILAKHYEATGSWKAVLRKYYGGTPEENTKYMLTVLKKAVKMRDITM